MRVSCWWEGGGKGVYEMRWGEVDGSVCEIGI